MTQMTQDAAKIMWTSRQIPSLDRYIVTDEGPRRMMVTLHLEPDGWRAYARIAWTNKLGQTTSEEYLGPADENFDNWIETFRL